MTLSNPELIDGVGYYDPSQKRSFAMWLWNNPGGYGYARFEFYNTQGELISRASECFDEKTGLNYLSTVEITTAQVINNFDIKAFRCATDTDQSCPLGVCTNLVHTSTLTNRSVVTISDVVPNAPANLKVVPGNNQLSISWDKVTNTDIFSYYVKVTEGGVIVIDGYLTSDQQSVLIENLKNGTVYEIEVAAVSTSRSYGNPGKGSGTPAPQRVGSVLFLSTPPGAKIILDGIDQNKTTPFTIPSIPIGSHSYTLKLTGYPDAKGTVTVKENQIVQVSVNFITGQTNIGLLILGIGIAAALFGGLIYFIRDDQRRIQ